MYKEIDTVEHARYEIRAILGLTPDSKPLERDEMDLLYEQLTGDFSGDAPARRLSMLIAEELEIPRGRETAYLRKAELLAAIGRLNGT